MDKSKSRGVVYTSHDLVVDIYRYGGYAKTAPAGLTADIACGEGAFLVPLVTRLINEAKTHQEAVKFLEERLYGADIDPIAINICRQKLDAEAKKYGIENVRWNLEVLNVATHNFVQKNRGRFDTVVGNPPYIRVQNMDKITRKFVQKLKAGSAGATDLYLAFIEIALICSKKQVLYITPSSWMRSRAGKALRQMFVQKGVLYGIWDFGARQVFSDVLTYVAVIDLRKTSKKENFLYTNGRSDENVCWAVNTDKLLKKLPDYSPDTASISQEYQKTCTLGDIAKISTGLATLADTSFIGKVVYEDNDFADLIMNGQTIRLEKTYLRKIAKASTIQFDDEDQKLRIIYPYKDNEQGKFQLVDENTLQTTVPLTYAYLLTQRPKLMRRDRGRPRAQSWYAYGRSQGINGLFGDCLLTSNINKTPKFIRDHDPNSLFYSGYCIQAPSFILDLLAHQLNSQRMQIFIETYSRPFQQGWWAYSKHVLEQFPIEFNDHRLESYFKSKASDRPISTRRKHNG